MPPDSFEHQSSRENSRAIAIVGLACRFPGARDATEFADGIVSAKTSIREVPADRWDVDAFYDPSSRENDRISCRHGGYLDEPILIDPVETGVMPIAIDGCEPEQLLVLDAARAALIDANFADGVPKANRTEVIIGRGNYFNRGNLTRLQHGRIIAQTLAILKALHPERTDTDWAAVRADLKSGLPPFEAETIPGQLTNATAGRTAKRFDFRGSSFVVDAASASSLVAIDLGVQALRNRRADIVIAAGVYLEADVDFRLVFERLGVLSPSGTSRPFRKDADGMVPGEGVGVVVLKRCKDAERDGDRIYALIREIGVSSDGRDRGLAAPSAKGHARAMRLAYRRAGIDPASVDLIEGHGLAVPASDRAELKALRSIFPASRRRVLASPSLRFGHAMPAAGMAGLIEAVVALRHRLLPAGIAANARPHPLLADDERPATLISQARPWIVADENSPRRAGVNAFGFGGINAHAIIEEYRGPNRQADGFLSHWETEAFLLGATDREAWCRQAETWIERLEGGMETSLKDLAYTVNVDEAPRGFRVGLVARSFDDLRERLRKTVERIRRDPERPIQDAGGTYHTPEPFAGDGRLAFVFAGEGSQYPGMLAELCFHFPEVQELFDTGDRVSKERSDEPTPADRLFGEESLRDSSGLWSIETAINVVLTAHAGIARLLEKLEIRPDRVVGHSSGEFLALAASGAIAIDRDFENRIGRLGSLFGRLESTGSIPSARLVAVAAESSLIEAACREIRVRDVAVALDNCPHQVVVAGPPDSLELLASHLKSQGVFCETLPFDRAYHTTAFESTIDPIRDFFADLKICRPRLDIYSCATAEKMPPDPEEIRRLAVEQWSRRVSFRETIEKMHADGARIFVEIGARGNLASFIADTLRNRPHLAIPACLPRRSPLTQLNHLVAALFAQGVSLRPDHLYARRRPKKVDVSHKPKPARSVTSLSLGFPAMRLSREAQERFSQSQDDLDLPHAIFEGHTNGFVPQPNLLSSFSLPSAEREGVVEEGLASYFETMQEFLSLQQDVMRTYLGDHRVDESRMDTDGTFDSIAFESSKPFSETPSSKSPWLDEWEILEPGGELIARRILKIADDPIAENHTLGGRRVSELDSTRRGLPVVPFAAMAEMIVQAAAELAPGKTLIGLRELHARKWIQYESKDVVLTITARLSNKADTIDVAIYNETPKTTTFSKEATETLAATGTVVFAEERIEPPAASEFHQTRPRACRFKAAELYEDQWLFHGPAFQGVVEIGLSSLDGIEGSLKILPRSLLARKCDVSNSLLDVISFDSFTHILGCWGLDQLTEGDVIFPLRLGSLELFGQDPPAGETVRCRIFVKSIESHRVRVDAELVRDDGSVWMRLCDWEDWRFYWPNRYRDVFRQPHEILIGESVDPAVEARNQPIVWLEPPADMGRPIWREVLEKIQLNDAEREALRRDGEKDEIVTLRLWGWIAAKEAARRLWLEQGDRPRFPADLNVVESADETGFVERPNRRRSNSRTPIAIARAEGAVAAIAGADRSEKLGVGIIRAEDARDDWNARMAAALKAGVQALKTNEVKIISSNRQTSEAAISSAINPSETVRVRTCMRGRFALAWTLSSGGEYT